MPHNTSSQLVLSTFLNTDFRCLEIDAAKCLDHPLRGLVYKKTIKFTQGCYLSSLARFARRGAKTALASHGYTGPFKVKYQGTVDMNGKWTHWYHMLVPGQPKRHLSFTFDRNGFDLACVGEPVLACFEARCLKCKATITMVLELEIDEGKVVSSK